MSDCIRWLVRVGWVAAWAVMFSLGVVRPAQADGPIVLDGQFADWNGQPGISDPQGDGGGNTTDLLMFSFAAVDNDDTAYFMVQRGGGSQWFDCTLLIDTNNDGIYTDLDDRMIVVSYKPKGNSSTVSVDVHDGTGGYLFSAGSGDWGETTKEGGSRLEFGVVFSDLGIAAGQPIRMILQSMSGSQVMDATDEVQWSPANALGWVLLGGIVLAGSAGMAWVRQRGAAH